ncbi:DNA-binding PucR family transcriptional regulator [Nocardioides sp. BE266]|uniref:PucR family transcriptional regulator n=1 Tax=Nocardioides sp. BE266 TaxID=2817725 RepID=UPI00285DC871|nr:helix-turn-helix domain-containing protein [Nocardioides sp. BE266]MDR7254223.1 DNA-binding PucR family transcriptional regulator [Nocardioides sp. BE266]
MTAAVEGPVSELERRNAELSHRLSIELGLAGVCASGGGIAALVQAAADRSSNPIWLIDPRRRVVARSAQVRGSEFKAPDVDLLLEEHGPVDLASLEPVLIPARPARGIARRHLLVPVARDNRLFAWLVVAEVSSRLAPEAAWLTHRTAFHLAGEYAVQRRLASASWNARAALARQLVRGSNRDEDVTAAADYLGVRVDADRVLVYLADAAVDDPRDEQTISDLVARELGVEVLGARGREGTILLVEALADEPHVSLVQHVKNAMRRVVRDLGEPDAIVGVSAVTRADALQRSYRETREVVLCVDRFARGGDRVIAVDDLGPARLLVANGDVGAVRRYVDDVLGALLGDVPGSSDLLKTLQCFFDTGRSVRESAARLGIHENTVRLRMGKIHDLTGLDVASNSNDQLSAQTALLVLRLEGHPAIPPFDGHDDAAEGEEHSA